MDDTLTDLLRYAAKQGVQLTGIMPRRLPGRGYGMVATRDVPEGETVLAVPTRALRTLATVPKPISRTLDRDVSVHGILAAHLVLDNSGEYAAWDAVLPTPADLEAGMPLLWHAKLQELLPTPARAALARQQAKLQRDWECVKAAFGKEEAGEKEKDEKDGEGGEGGEKEKKKTGEKNVKGLERSTYVRAWLLVNSRTFYYTTPRSEATLPSHDDRIAMQPVADLFNHAADRGCRAAYAAGGFTFVADRPYKRGDEVPISYGAHSNDALLVEYGFVLADSNNNRWDEVSLDAVILPRLTAAHPQLREDLEAAGFWAGYMIDAATPGGCYRTQVALRRLLCGSTTTAMGGTGSARRTAWLQFVERGGDEEVGDDGTRGRADDASKAVEELLLTCLDDMAEVAHKMLVKIGRWAKIQRLNKGGTVGTESQWDLLAQRWRQIEAMVAQAAKQLRGGDEEE